MLFIGNIRERLTLISLDARDYFGIAETSAETGLTSGAIYDAILAHCAMKANAEVIYTWNTNDFLRLAPAVAKRVKAPGPPDRI